jgi:hypothetical protein
MLERSVDKRGSNGQRAEQERGRLDDPKAQQH